MSFCFNALKSSTLFNQIILESLEKEGFSDLSPSLLSIFAHLAEREPVSVSALANLLSVSRQAMHKSIKILEGSNYITLEKRPTNRKEKMVVLTDRGEELVQCALMTIAMTEQKMADFLGTEAFKLFIENQERLTKFLESISHNEQS